MSGSLLINTMPLTLSPTLFTSLFTFSGEDTTILILFFIRIWNRSTIWYTSLLVWNNYGNILWLSTTLSLLATGSYFFSFWMIFMLTLVYWIHLKHRLLNCSLARTRLCSISCLLLYNSWSSSILFLFNQYQTGSLGLHFLSMITFFAFLAMVTLEGSNHPDRLRERLVNE